MTEKSLGRRKLQNPPPELYDLIRHQRNAERFYLYLSYLSIDIDAFVDQDDASRFH
jgi:hypothetical protein